MTRFLQFLPAMVLACIALPALAHKPSDSYLVASVSPGANTVSGHWDIALRDLEIAVELDANHDGAITWGELRGQENKVFDYAFAHLAFKADEVECPITRGELMADTHSDGAYAVLAFEAHCAAPPLRLEIGYHLLFDLDPSHRGLLALTVDGGTRTAVLSPEQSVQTFDLAHVSHLRQFLQFVADGMHHIWIGYDHLLFLISLLLPAVLVRRRDDPDGIGHWVPVPSLRSALWSVFAVVSAFTLSHSITLTLAALGVIGLPSRLVESGIALSVMLAALNNIFPRVTRRAWLLAFFFGLVHGFGFASVLNDLGLPRDALALSLAGFNVGVEFGQLSVVLVVVPLIYLMRKQRYYRPIVLVGGSSVIVAVAAVWFFGRVFGFGLG